MQMILLFLINTLALIIPIPKESIEFYLARACYKLVMQVIFYVMQTYFLSEVVEK